MFVIHHAIVSGYGNSVIGVPYTSEAERQLELSAKPCLSNRLWCGNLQGLKQPLHCPSKNIFVRTNQNFDC